MSEREIQEKIKEFLENKGITAEFKMGYAVDYNGESFPFIEVITDIDDLNELVRIWKETINYLEKMSPEPLEKVDILFSRKRRLRRNEGDC